jgi:O-antigen ligase
MTTSINKTIIYQILFGITIFLIPSNLFLKFFESSAYVHGLLVDYLLPRIYMSDISILALIGVWLLTKKLHYPKILQKVTSFIQKNKFLSFLIFAFILRQYNAQYPLASLWYLFKIGEMIVLVLVLFDIRKLLPKNLVIGSLMGTIFFQSSLALYQFFYQNSVFGYLFLGEADFDKQIGLAKQTISGVEKILPYGTTAHPNILGGFLALSLLLVLFLITKKPSKKESLLYQPIIIIPLIMGLISLGLTFSLSAWLVFGVGVFCLFVLKKQSTLLSKKYTYLIGLLILISPVFFVIGNRFSDNLSITRRAYLNKAGFVMLKDNPIWGVGLNNFTSYVEAASSTREVVRFVQPSHHSLILLLSEIGVLGIAVVVLLMYKNRTVIKKNHQWLVLLVLIISPVLIFDHYVVTNQTGLLLFTFLLFCFRNYVSPHLK